MRHADPSEQYRRLAVLRVSAQGLAGPQHQSPLGVLDRLLALQAQDHAASQIAVSVRRGAPTTEVADTLAEGALVRTWPMRGTLHLIRPHDLAWLLPLCRDRAARASRGRHARLGLSENDVQRAADVVRERLTGARASRTDVLGAIRAAGVDTAGQRGAHLIVRLAQDGVIVLCGKDVLARYDDVVPTSEPLERGTALARLALRYVDGHGPVTDRDLAWWAGLTLADARAGLATARRAHPDRIDVMAVDGREYHVPTGLVPAEPRVLLLPGFDEYVLGYSDRSAQLAGQPLECVVPGKNGMFLATIVVDGHVAGTWRRRPGAGRREIDITWFRPLPARRRAELDTAVDDLGRLTGVPAGVRMSPPI